MKRTPLVTAIVAAMLISACGSDSSQESFGQGPPTTSSAPPPTAPNPPPSSGTSMPQTSETPDTQPTTAPASTVPVISGPLPEPSGSLTEVGSFDQPVEVAVRPGDDTFYVVERPGRVIAVRESASDVVLDISDLTEAQGERGLLGLAFHPTADLAYAHYTDSDGDSVVAEYAVDATTGRFDPASAREVLTVDQPYSNHNGGQIAFGPDDLLYISLGDGGSGGDPDRYALDLTSRLGKILRIDPNPSAEASFTVPDDNPFVDDATADPTIWAYGLRNAWRFSFDPATGDLWIGDVGQNEFEEINHSVSAEGLAAARGANFGWSAFEGFERFNDDQSADGPVLPVFVYDHGGGRCSVTGGAVARGDDAGDLAGWYVFGDYCSGQIWALDPTAPPSEPRVVEIAQLGALVSVSVGPDGELYAVSDSGTIARLTPEV